MSVLDSTDNRYSHLKMTFAMRLGIHSQLGHGFRVKLTPQGGAIPLGGLFAKKLL